MPEDKTFDHEYDGIREYDNPLPAWWVWMFIGTVIWSIAYVPYYHFGPGLLPSEAHAQDMEAWNEAHPPSTMASGAELEAMAGDAALAEKGKATYDTLCVACHAPDGGGLVGPNLTDDFAIHGYSMESIVKIVHDGVPEKGMIAWKAQLSMDQIYAVSAYVHSLRGKPAANPKAPQGDPIR